jgi:hypothetical protein
MSLSFSTKSAFLTLASCAYLSIPAQANAARQGLVAQEKLSSTTIEMPQSKTKDIFCLEGTPGLAKPRGSQFKFISFKSKTKVLKKRGAPAAKLKKFRMYNKLGKTACAEIPAATPTPTPSSTPAPTPVPPVENPYFDLITGEVKPAGLDRFEIPEGVSANLFRGERNIEGTCSCHDTKSNPLPQNWTFPQYRERTSQSPMFFVEESLTNEELADIVAWLNRSAN